ncbi:putative S-layer protein, partial [Candidatus Woesearchaeota archaeon]|nr:putative S-layer protein [Candidatus Woesearchaeota archaeon]
VAPGDSETITLRIRNTDNVNLSNFAFSYDTMKDEHNNDIILTFTNPCVITPGNTANSDMKIKVDGGMEFDGYESLIRIVSGNLSYSFKLKISVHPRICEDGIRKEGNLVGVGGSYFDILIVNPERDDPFNLGETINVEAKVKNIGDNRDVTVEAVLFNIDGDETVAFKKSEAFEIKKDRARTFKIDLKVPTTKIDPDDDFKLYVKAYDSFNEEDNCDTKGIRVNLKRSSSSISMDKLKVNPNIVNCGESFTLTADIDNGLKSAGYATLRVYNTQIGLDEESERFRLYGEDFITKAVTSTLPENIKPGVYPIYAEVDNGDKKVTDSVDLKINCNGYSYLKNNPKETTAKILTYKSNFVVEEGGSLSLPVLVTNNGNEKVQFTVDANPEWANRITPISLMLEPGQTSTVYLYIMPKSGNTGINTVTVNLKSNDNLIGTDVAYVEVEPGYKEEKTTFPLDAAILFGGKGANKYLVILLDLFLIIIVIFLIKYFYGLGRGNKREEF